MKFNYDGPSMGTLEKQAIANAPSACHIKTEKGWVPLWSVGKIEGEEVSHDWHGFGGYRCTYPENRRAFGEKH